MSYKKQEGICHICGKLLKLSKEHIPPKSSGNIHNVKYHTWDEILAEDFLTGKKDLKDMKFHISQGGMKLPTLCETCNNTTGELYVRDYSELANFAIIGLNQIQQDKSLNHFIEFTYKVKPLNFLKEVVAMLCSVLDPQTVKKHKLGEYVLDKNLRDLPKDVNIFMYLSTTKNGYLRSSPLMIIGDAQKGKKLFLSELSVPPFGFFISFSKNCEIDNMLKINNMSAYNYNEETEFNFYLPLLRPVEFPLQFEGYKLI